MTSRDFWEGVGSIVNPFRTGPRPIRISDNPSRDDSEALRSDWEHIAADINKAMRRHLEKEA